MTVDEDGGVARFTVSMSEASDETVTVAYATSDGTARSGTDYTAVSGTLTIPMGDTQGSIAVPVLDDSFPENDETFTVALSSPVGATIGDGVGVGTIRDETDPAIENWILPFATMASAHAIDAIEERMLCRMVRRFEEGSSGRLSPRWRCGPRYQGSSSLVVGGHRMLGGVTWAEDAVPSYDWTGYGETRRGGASHASRSLSAAESLAGSSFQFSTGAGDAGRSFYLWGRGAYSRFGDGAGPLEIDGDVRSVTVGTEFASKRVLAGLALSHSLGTGSLSDGHGRGAGDSDLSLSGIYPYAHFSVHEWLSVWGTAGLGSGSLDLSMPDGERARMGLSMRMAAAGVRNEIWSATAVGGPSLVMDTDMMVVRVRSDETDRLSAGDASANRLGVAIEGSYTFVTENGEVAPYVDLRVRHDGGDGETGLGMEIGGGMRYAHPVLDLTSEFGVHGLLAHEADRVSEWGVSGSIRYDPYSSSGRGLSLRLASSWGAEATRGPGALWRHQSVAESLLYGGLDAGARIDAEVGYGFPVRHSTGTGMPWVGVTLTERSRDYRLGYRYRFGRSVAMGIEGLIRDGVKDGEPSDHAVMLRLHLH